MHRLFVTSVSLLVVALSLPACGAVLGIDTERALADAGGAEAGVTSSASVDSGGAETFDGGQTAACEVGLCGRSFGGTCGSDKRCTATCGTGETCNGRVFNCPENHDCVVQCAGKECDKATCRGGRSCTFECVNGSCAGTLCESSICTFRCAGDKCVMKNNAARCAATVTTCNVECSSSLDVTCKKEIECCGRVCPPSTGTCSPRPGPGDDDDG